MSPTELRILVALLALWLLVQSFQLKAREKEARRWREHLAMLRELWCQGYQLSIVKSNPSESGEKDSE